MELGLGVELHLPAGDALHTTSIRTLALSYFGISGENVTQPSHGGSVCRLTVMIMPQGCLAGCT